MVCECMPSRRLLVPMTAVVVLMTGLSVFVAQSPSTSASSLYESAFAASSPDGAPVDNGGEAVPLEVGVNSPMFLELHGAARPSSPHDHLPTTPGGGSSNVIFPLSDIAMPFVNPYNLPDKVPPTITAPTRTSKDIAEMVAAFDWAPGGVRGATRDAVDVALNQLFQDARTSREVRSALCAGSATPVRGLIASLAESLARLDTASNLGDDCRYLLTPFQRAMCIVMALADDEADGVPLHERRVYRDSNCRVLAPCADWARGRFSTPLSVERLQQVYRDVVVPSVGAHANTVRAFSRQFLHGEGNFEELKWLMRRSKAMDDDLRKRNRKAGRLKANKPCTDHNMSTPTAMRDVFQGQRVVVTNDTHQDAGVSDSDGGGSPPLPVLPPLAVLAALHQMIGPALEGDGEGGALNVMVFNGDSVNREVFHRLIHCIRFGDDRRPLERAGNPRYFPHFHYATHYDMVYVVHPTHDELLGFHSPQTNGSSTYTVERYFREVRRNVTRWRAARASGDRAAAGTPPVALMYVVWYWDPFTSMPRPCAFGPDVGAFAEGNHDPIDVATASNQGALGRLGVRVSVLLQGTAFWERTQGDALMQFLSDDAKLLSEDNHRTGGIRAVATPRRLYLLSAVSEDLLTAYPQHLTHRLYNASLPEQPYLQLRISSKTPNFNIRKNIGYFKWLRAVAVARRGVTPEMLRYGAVHILDKAKVQFLGEPMGDKIHFTCRGGFATGKPKFFEHAFASHSLEDLLLGAHGSAADHSVRFCNRTANAVALLKSLQAQARGAKFALWTVSGMEATRVHGYHLAGSMVPSALHHCPQLPAERVSNQLTESTSGAADSLERRRTVVYMFPDGSRRTCTDPGDGLLVQLLLQNPVLSSIAIADV